MAANDETPNADDTDETAVIDAHQAPVPPTQEAELGQPAAPGGPRLRDTVWNFRSMIAVAVASLLIGGAAGAAITGAVSHDDHPGRTRISNLRGGAEMPGLGGPYQRGEGNGPRQFGQNGSQSGPGGTQRGGQGFAPGSGTTPAAPSAPQSGTSD